MRTPLTLRIGYKTSNSDLVDSYQSVSSLNIEISLGKFSFIARVLLTSPLTKFSPPNLNFEFKQLFLTS